MIRALLLAGGLLLSACSQAGTFAVSGVELALADHGGQCRLVAPALDLQVDLEIPWPCQVHRDVEGGVRTHVDSGRTYILLESSVPHPELPDDCLTRLQAVVLEDGGIRASEVSDTVASCPPFQWDTKVFTGMFRE